MSNLCFLLLFSRRCRCFFKRSLWISCCLFQWTSLSFAFFQEREEVLKKASESNVPIIAIFLGKQECPWSQKIEQELLLSPSFKEQLEEEACLWVLAACRDPHMQEFEKRYAVEKLPCILLLDPQGKEFARLDYDASHPDLLLERVLTFIEDFDEICRSMDQGLELYDEWQLQSLYIKAARLSVPCFKQVILRQGLSQEKGTFFHLEKYALLVKKLKLKHPEVLKLKKKMVSRDPQNHWGTHYKIALIEFEKRASMLKQKDSAEKAIAPLVHYLDRFGNNDRQNRWKIEMQIAEFLFTKQVLSVAFNYAKQAASHAPPEFRPQILKTIAYMKGVK